MLNNVSFALNIYISVMAKELGQILCKRPAVLALAYSFINLGKHSYVREQLDFSSIRQERSPELDSSLHQSVLTSLSFKDTGNNKVFLLMNFSSGA